MSKAISLGTKKKSFKSIMEAAKVVASQTGENLDRVYIRLYMRMRSGKKPVTAMKQAPRKYVKREQVEQQVTA